MKKILFPVVFSLFSLNSFAAAINEAYNISNGNLFSQESIVLNKAINISQKKIGDFSSYYLDNGIKVILLPFPNTENTGVFFTARVGSKNEGYGETGMAHLLEHMLFKGTTNFPDIKKELTDIGAQWNGFTSADQTTYFEIFHNDSSNKKLDKVINLEAQRFFEATFTKNDLDKEMTVVRNELEKNASSSQTQLWESTLQKTFDWHGYKHPTIGEKSDIENAPFSKLHQFYKKHYQPKNSFLIVYGDFKVEDVQQIIDKHLSKYKNLDNDIVNNWTQEPFAFKKSDTTIYTLDNIISSNVVWKAPSFLYDEKQIAADILFNSVTQEPYGSLYKKYILNKSKDKNNYINNISTFIFPQNDYSPFVLNIQQKIEKNVNPQKNNQSIIEDIEAGTFFNKEDFNKLKASLIADFDKVLSNPEAITKHFLQSESLGDWSLFFYQKKLVEQAKFEDGIKFLKEYLSPYNRTVINIQKDPNIKDNSYSNFVQKYNSENYRNKIVDKINKIKDDEYLFQFKKTDKFSPSLSNFKDKTKLFEIKDKNKNIYIKTHLIQKNTLGDFVYFNLKNDYGDEPSLTKYGKMCSLLELAPSLGGKNYDKEKLDNFMRERQADYSVSFSNLGLKVPKQHFSESLKVLIDVLINPSFSEKEYEILKNQILLSFEESKTDIAQINKESLISSLNPYPKNHPLYKETINENIEIIKKSNLNDLKKCYSLFKGASHSTISLVGNINEDELKDSISNYMNWESLIPFKKIEDTEIKPFLTSVKDNGGSKVKVISEIKKPNSFNLKKAYLPMSVDDPDYVKIRTALIVFGESSNSRLFKALREDNGLSYTAQADIDGNHFYNKTALSSFVISAVDNADKSNQIIDQTWEDFVEKGITEEELINAKKIMLDRRLNSISSDTSILSLVNFFNNYNRTVDWLIEYDNKIQQLTVEEVNNAIKKHLSNIQFITVYNK